MYGMKHYGNDSSTVADNVHFYSATFFYCTAH